MPTYRSTGTTSVIIIEQDSDGTRRVARAVQDDANGRMWRTQLEHPSGVRVCSNVFGGKDDASLALTHYLLATEPEWRAEKARGHRPAPSRTIADRTVALDEGGNVIGGAPVVARR